MIRCFTFAILLGLGACSSRAPAPTGAAAPAGRAASPAAPPADPSGGTGSASGEPCGDHPACTPPATCVSYYGIAGPRGPRFQSCEIRCKDDSTCPKGTRCTTIADGPGRVCR